MEKKFVYSFNEGSKEMRDLLGGKGANLAEMTKIGLPVPFGFTVTTEAWGISSAGRAPGSQSGGQGFDPPMLHFFIKR